MLNRIRVPIALVAFSLSGLANASVIKIYSVSDAVTSHGLYTGSQTYNGDRSFNFQDDVFLTQYDDGTATLLGTAADSGVIWDLNVLFTGFNSVSDGSTKNGGGPTLASWEYYYSFTGTISNNLGDVVTISRVGPAMQIGIGANDKNGGFGASAWMHNYNAAGVNMSGHWDLNMNLTTVPEPATLGLLGVGLLGFGLLRRRKRSA